MTLLVDIGNSRVKWARTDGRALSPQQAAEHAQWDADDWYSHLFAGPDRPERVVAASVAGPARRDALRVAAARAGVHEVEFIETTASAAGVRNAYRTATLLGVDRWVAVIGAYHLARRACVVVDVGTAATIDVVDDGGQHRGGFIVPGPYLMVQSLHASTSDLAAHTAASTGAAGTLFADNTREAIERGCCVALAALVDRCQAEFAREVTYTPAVFCTGGGAALVLPYICTPVQSVPDLVLQGLACIVAARR